MSEPIKTKRCHKCNEIKPLSEFSKDKKGKNGLLCQCKKCRCNYVIQYQKTEKGKLVCKKANRKYSQSKKGKLCYQEYAQSKKFKLKNKQARKRIKLKYPQRIKARTAVNHAIREGKLPRPNSLKCSCSEPAQQYHHHKGYAPEHWLDVIPVCKKCHDIFR